MTDQTPQSTENVTRTTCLVPVWDDGIYRVRCSMGTKGVCAKHGPHKPHPDDGRTCDPMDDGYCCTHRVYMDPHRNRAGDQDTAGCAYFPSCSRNCDPPCSIRPGVSGGGQP